MPVNDDPFPQYTPFTDVPDLVSNAYPYFFPMYTYTDCSFNEEGNVECLRFSTQYVFDEGRESGDGNSDMDVYYTDDWENFVSPAGKPIVVVLHGASGNRGAAPLAISAVEMASRGYIAVVPDYITIADSKWGNVGFDEESCLDADELWYTVQQSVRDIRASIRRLLFLEAEEGSFPFPIDKGRIFVIGNSHGAYTAYHLAGMEASDFPTGEVSINGEDYTFSNDLDDQRICPQGDASCEGFSPGPGYDLRSSILGVSLVSPIVLDLDALRPATSDAGVLIFHGSCDSRAPYWECNQKDFVRRSILGINPNAPEPAIPCQDADSPDFPVYGSQRWYQQRLDAGELDDMYVGMFSICGAPHALRGLYGVNFGDGPTSYEIGMIQFETARFFANILNNTNKENFRFDLNHRLKERHPNMVDNHENNCTVVQNHGEAWPEELLYCPSCDAGNPDAIDILHLPYFRTSHGDDQRYPSLNIFLDSGQECADAEADAVLSAKVYDAPQRVLIEVYDMMGRPMRSGLSRMGYGLVDFLQSGHGLEKGMYALHFSDGSRETIFIY